MVDKVIFLSNAGVYAACLTVRGRVAAEVSVGVCRGVCLAPSSTFSSKTKGETCSKAGRLAQRQVLQVKYAL